MWKRFFSIKGIQKEYPFCQNGIQKGKGLWNVKGELTNMTRVWDEEKIWVPDKNQTHDLLNTRCSLYPLSYNNSWRAKSFNWVRGCKWLDLSSGASPFRTLKSNPPPPFPLACCAPCYQLLTWKLSWMHMAKGCHKLDRQTLACSRCMDNDNSDILHRIQTPHGEMLWCSWELGVDQVDKSVLPLAWLGPHGSQMVWNRK